MDANQRFVAAKAQLAADAQRRAEVRAEFAVTRPTPSQDECDRAADGEVVPLKQWDLSPVDQSSFDPTEPPGRPDDASRRRR